MRNRRPELSVTLSASSVASGRASKFWQIAVLATAGIIGSGSYATALPLDFWSDEIFDEPAPPPAPIQRRHYQPPQHRAPRAKIVTKPIRKPQRPLIVTISIQNQSLKVYDANGLFAEAPVSTGMRGHSTPLGVFSVIQKNKWHRSNIYSGAPMPYMQRLTWSGIAMHAGALPGYPASHGCIRMPTSFATQLWSWTRMGARVVVTPGEITPMPFAHSLLATQKLQPAPPAVATTEPPETTPSPSTVGVVSSADSSTAPVAQLHELRPSVMPATATLPSTETTGVAGSDKPTKVADASAAMSETAKTMLDGGNAATAAITEPVAAVAPPVVRRTGPIAVLISRKDGRLYARQNFEPLFDVPITIAPGDRPLGTHVFTAEADPANAGSYRWSALSLPAVAQRAEANHEITKRRRSVGAIETRPQPAPDGPSEALDRLTIPADAMTRIAEALTIGSSIIVSDQGLAGSETGQGTEFIVPLR